MTTSNGWTQVTRDRSRRHGRVAASTKLPPALKDYDLEKLREDFHNKARLWKGSTCRKKLFKILDRQRPEDGWNLSQAICLASGSFSRDNWEGRKRSVLQFVAFMDIVERLSMTSRKDITFYAQEPIFTTLDMEFLLDAGVKLLEEPQAEDFLNSETFAFVPFMERDTAGMRSLAKADLHLYIGTPLPDEDERHYASYYMPVFEEDPNVFDGLVVGWKLPAVED